MRNYLLIVLALLLTGCQPAVYPIDSPYYRIPLGSILVLNRDLTIPPHQARVIIQYGQVVSRKERDQYYPYCEFEILTLSESPQVIHPDRFSIQRLNKHMETSRQAVMYASLSLLGRDNPLVAYNTKMYLSSSVQPDVYRMSCMYWTDDAMDDHLTLQQIRDTLGEIFTIKIDT